MDGFLKAVVGLGAKDEKPASNGVPTAVQQAPILSNAEKKQITEGETPLAVESVYAPLLDAIKTAKEMAVEKKLTGVATKLEEAIVAVPTPEPERAQAGGSRRCRRTHRSKRRQTKNRRSKSQRRH